MIAATQDFLTAAYLLSWKDTFFARIEAMRIIAWAATSPTEWIELPKPAILKPVELWTGKQLLSVVFRPNKHSPIKINLRTKGKNYTGNEEEMNPNDTCT
jgi:DNA-directed RNA polymerase III subunit RPC1